ncbi:MAG: hypothetical protein HY319_05755 [Armatimonadetes bacterium]|nr:hypothetical protein [Armatimonadota bacterium]
MRVHSQIYPTRPTLRAASASTRADGPAATDPVEHHGSEVPTTAPTNWSRALLSGAFGAASGAVPIVGAAMNAVGGVAAGCLVGQRHGERSQAMTTILGAGLGIVANTAGFVYASATGGLSLLPSAVLGGCLWGYWGAQADLEG